MSLVSQASSSIEQKVLGRIARQSVCESVFTVTRDIAKKRRKGLTVGNRLYSTFVRRKRPKSLFSKVRGLTNCGVKMFSIFTDRRTGKTVLRSNSHFSIYLMPKRFYPKPRDYENVRFVLEQGRRNLRQVYFRTVHSPGFQRVINTTKQSEITTTAKLFVGWTALDYTTRKTVTVWNERFGVSEDKKSVIKVIKLDADKEKAKLYTAHQKKEITDAELSAGLFDIDERCTQTISDIKTFKYVKPNIVSTPAPVVSSKGTDAPKIDLSAESAAEIEKRRYLGPLYQKVADKCKASSKASGASAPKSGSGSGTSGSAAHLVGGTDALFGLHPFVFLWNWISSIQMWAGLYTFYLYFSVLSLQQVLSLQWVDYLVFLGYGPLLYSLCVAVLWWTTKTGFLFVFQKLGRGVFSLLIFFGSAAFGFIPFNIIKPVCLVGLLSMQLFILFYGQQKWKELCKAWWRRNFKLGVGLCVCVGLLLYSYENTFWLMVVYVLFHANKGLDYLVEIFIATFGDCAINSLIVGVVFGVYSAVLVIRLFSERINSWVFVCWAGLGAFAVCLIFFVIYHLWAAQFGWASLCVEPGLIQKIFFGAFVITVWVYRRFIRNKPGSSAFSQTTKSL